MGVGIHDTRKAEEATAVEDLAGIARGNAGRDPHEAPVSHAEIEEAHRRLVGPDDPDVLDDEVERRCRGRWRACLVSHDALLL